MSRASTSKRSTESRCTAFVQKLCLVLLLSFHLNYSMRLQAVCKLRSRLFSTFSTGRLCLCLLLQNALKKCATFYFFSGTPIRKIERTKKPPAILQSSEAVLLYRSAQPSLLTTQTQTRRLQKGCLNRRPFRCSFRRSFSYARRHKSEKQHVKSPNTV